MRICYVNGRYVSAPRAVVPMEDRGYHFADGVYEVIVFFNGKFLDEDLHLERLRHSRSVLSLPPPMPDAALRLVMRNLLARHAFRDGYLYLQITRGVAHRDHAFPKNTRPFMTMFVNREKKPTRRQVEQGVPAVTAPDLRWGRCDAKTIALLPNVLARQASIEAGAREVWLTNEAGFVTEGSHSNAWLVKEGRIVTHPADRHILNGVRRQVLLRLCREHGIAVEERPFHVSEIAQAEGAFMTSATSNLLSVTRMDGTAIGSGTPCPLARRLYALYQQHVTAQTGKEWEY
jgi:D-alanine transaminase